LLQTVDDARLLMRHVDPDLGRPLPEKSYGGNCFIYDKERPDDPYHNFWVLISVIVGFYQNLSISLYTHRVQTQ